MTPSDLPETVCWNDLVHIFNSSEKQREQIISRDSDGSHYWLLYYKTVSQIPTDINAVPLFCKMCHLELIGSL